MRDEEIQRPSQTGQGRVHSGIQIRNGTAKGPSRIYSTQTDVARIAIFEIWFNEDFGAVINKLHLFVFSNFRCCAGL